MNLKKHLPNAITCCNLISGCIAILSALYGDARLALAWIVAGAVFDFFDGMVARLAKVSSPVGKELDSLADIVTFGVAPASILFVQLSVMDWPAALTVLPSATARLLPYSAFVMAAFSALRLAKFNLDTRQTTSFIGLPTPANALFWASLLTGVHGWLESLPWSAPALLLLMALCCWLLVSEIPMFALKFKQWGWRGNQTRYLFLLSCVPILLLFRTTGIAIIIAWYILLSLLMRGKA